MDEYIPYKAVTSAIDLNQDTSKQKISDYSLGEPTVDMSFGISNEDHLLYFFSVDGDFQSGLEIIIIA